jgi:hypothetical protein
MLGGVGGGRRRRHRVFVETSPDTLQRIVSFSGAQIRVDSQQFKGGCIDITVGGVQLDLRRATLAGQEVTLDVDNFMGGLEIQVPEGWRIHSDISPMMGGIEDRTLPVPPEAMAGAPTLRLRGSLVMGGISVKN